MIEEIIKKSYNDDKLILSCLFNSPEYHLYPQDDPSTAYMIDGMTEKVISLEPFALKWNSFGRHIIGINRNEIREIINVLDDADEIKEKPVAIIAHTI